MLKVHDISKSFSSHPVLSRFSIELNAGQSLGLLGPSGCGKTTALRIIAGLERADQGRVQLADQIWTEGTHHLVPPEKRGIGFVFQNYALWPHLSVREHLEFPLRMQNKKDPSRVQEILELLQIEKLQSRMPAQLSGGQQQRVALGRALIAAPQLVLFDEPLSNLDASLRSQVRSEIRKLQEKFGFASLLVSHDWDDVSVLCDQVVVMHEGRILQKGSPQELKSQPANDFVAAMVQTGDSKTRLKG